MMSPKGRFNTSPDRAKGHAHIIVQPQFLDAIDAALLQYGYNLDAKATADVTSGVLLRGAREFIQVFLSLTDKPTVVPRKDHDNLQNV